MPRDAGSRPLVLALDAATYVGSVAVLAPDGSVLAEGEAAMRGAREERLMPAVAEALRGAGARPADVGSVVCGGGPGSFTSLRIAASIAKGLATARGVPLYAVSSLWLVAAGVRAPLAAGRYLAAIDALRGEWFVSEVVVDADGAGPRAGGWMLAARATLDAELAAGTRLLAPPPLGDQAPHARGAAAAVAELGVSLAPVDLDRWEPDYGRQAEAQVRWEATHGRALATAIDRSTAAGG